MNPNDRLFIANASEPMATLRRADSFAGRLRGLLGEKDLHPGTGLWIVPCTSVHTFFMRFPIDVAFVDDQGRIVKLVEHLVAGRLAFARRASSVVEFAAGSIARMGLATGQRLEWTSVDKAARAPLIAASLRHQGRV